MRGATVAVLIQETIRAAAGLSGDAVPLLHSTQASVISADVGGSHGAPRDETASQRRKRPIEGPDPTIGYRQAVTGLKPVTPATRAGFIGTEFTPCCDASDSLPDQRSERKFYIRAPIRTGTVDLLPTMWRRSLTELRWKQP